MKRMMMMALAAIIIVGGTVAAFVLTDKSSKEKYFLAEKNTLEHLVEQVEKRYQPELDWATQSAENPTESVMEISAELNNPAGGSYGLMSPEQLINNSTITVTTATDKQEKLLTSKIEGSLGDFEIGGVDVSITSEKIMVGLPFLEEILQLNGNDIGKLGNQLDPNAFTGEETFDFGMVFEGNNVLPEEDLNYLKEEYVAYTYNKLPDSAFQSSDEAIIVDSETLETEKLTLHLSEEDFKSLLSDLFSKMATDTRLKEIIKEQYQLQTFGALTVPKSSMLMEEANQIVDDFTSAMEEASKEVLNFSIPNGLNSTIWIYDDLVVKRDFELELGPNEKEIVTFFFHGSHIMDEINQSFEYTIGYQDTIDEGELNISGQLSLNEDKINDSIQFSAEGIILAYQSSETLSDNEREFERTFSIDDGTDLTGKLLWSGNASFENDQMTSNHQLSMDGQGISQDLFTLHLSKDSKTISTVEMPNESQVKDLGSMDINELMMYIEMEVTPQFEQWLFGMMGPGF